MKEDVKKVSDEKLTTKNSRKRSPRANAVASNDVKEEPKQPFYTTKVYIVLCVVLFLAGGVSSLLMHIYGGKTASPQMK